MHTQNTTAFIYFKFLISWNVLFCNVFKTLLEITLLQRSNVIFMCLLLNISFKLSLKSTLESLKIGTSVVVFSMKETSSVFYGVICSQKPVKFEWFMALQTIKIHKCLPSYFILFSTSDQTYYTFSSIVSWVVCHDLCVALKWNFWKAGSVGQSENNYPKSTTFWYICHHCYPKKHPIWTKLGAFTTITFF